MFPIKENKREGKVTISIGVAAVKDGEELTPEKLTKKADDALYDSKEKREKSGKFQQSQRDDKNLVMQGL